MREPYRSSEGAPSKRRRDADELIATHEAKLGPSALLVVPASLRERIEALRAGAGENASDDDRAELSEALEKAVGIAQERVDDLRAFPAEHPDAPEQDDRWGPAGTESAAASTVTDVREAALSLDPAGEVTLMGPRITARFRVRGAPVLWSIHLGGEVSLQYGAPVQAFTRSSHWMATSAPRDLPEVFIRRETLTDKVLGALHLRLEPQVEDAAFDAAFFLERGDADYLRAVLDRRLRRVLLARAELGDFTFLHRDAEASLAWKTSLVSLVRPEAFAASVEILVAFRAALEGLELLRA